MSENLRDFYKNKKILLLGHSTFMGSWLAMMLHSLHAEVIGCSIKPPVFPNLYHEADIEELITSYIGDVRDFEFINTIIHKHQPEIVIHLSAVSGFCDSIEPKELYNLNLLGVLNALEVCKQAESVRVFVNLVPDYSRGTIFKSCDKKNQGEMDLIMGSFRSTEFLTTGYRNAYFDVSDYQIHRKAIVNMKILPPLGGGDWSKNNIVQDYVRSVSKSKKEIVSHPGNIHTMIHVLDVIDGSLIEVRRLFIDPLHNIADYKLMPDQDFFRDETWVTQTFCEIWGEGTTYKVQHNDKITSKDTRLSESNTSSFQHVQDWQPRWDAESALGMTIAWEQARERGANMQRFSLGQIEGYLGEM
ncbi:MAG: GDP-mannose 4,6-dehydratase [Paludibacter sp.]|nr:GDP-mannose 4,6-dehydratase [Paludibacter sp.]